MLSISAFPALVLNADFSPISLTPLKVYTWQKAVQAALSERVVVVESYDRTIRCPGSMNREAFEVALPSVIALKDYQSTQRRAPFNRAAIFMRDGYRCAYCNGRFPARELTFDHIHPRSQGGRTSWENVISACSQCNSRKADKTVKAAGMKMYFQAFAPSCAQLDGMARKNARWAHREIPAPWRFYLGLQEEAAAREPCSFETSGAFPSGMTSEDYWYAHLDG